MSSLKSHAQFTLCSSQAGEGRSKRAGFMVYRLQVCQMRASEHGAYIILKKDQSPYELLPISGLPRFGTAIWGRLKVVGKGANRYIFRFKDCGQGFEGPKL